ncbi:MAG: AarF/UbiB family protein, partial [Actinomycetota bacterium]
MTDLDWGAFSDNPPWVLNRDEISWLSIAPVLRQAARKEVPVLTKPSRIPPVLRLLVVTRVLLIALLPWLWHKKLNHYKSDKDSRSDISKRMRQAVEKLGSTYIKLGQIISSGEGLFPTELVDEFKLCRDQVPAESFADVRKVVEHDLGAPIEDVFEFFDKTPLAAASIAQVHLARLHTGETVVVKVQRPRVIDLVRKDLKVMSWLAPHLVG